jgi:hypothetical protein
LPDAPHEVERFVYCHHPAAAAPPPPHARASCCLPRDWSPLTTRAAAAPVESQRRGRLSGFGWPRNFMAAAGGGPALEDGEEEPLCHACVQEIETRG